MALADKMHKVDMGQLQPIVQEIGLGATKPNTAPTCIITGTITAAGTGTNSAAVSTGGVASKVIAVDVAGTTYYLPLFSSNA